MSNNYENRGSDLAENSDSHDEAMPEHGMSDKNVVTIPMDMLPPGVTLKDGDKITFCVHGEPDQSGVTGYFEKPEMGEGKEDWESDFRKEMSPQSKSDAPM